METKVIDLKTGTTENQTTDYYMVPFDFTKTTENALKYCLKLANKNKTSIVLVHVVKKEKFVTEAKLKLELTIQRLKPEYSKLIHSKVLVGNVFESLGKEANGNKDLTVVMGTHGPSGLKKLFKSNALKVISNSKVPFLITQENHNKDRIKTIVMPFNFEKQSIQVTKFAASLAKKYNATIHLVGQRDKDEWLLKNLTINQNIVKKHLIKNNVRFETKILNTVKSTYELELIKYANEIDADLIAATYFPTGIKSLYNPFLQQMIGNNHKIPVFTINAQNLQSNNSNYSFLSV